MAAMPSSPLPDELRDFLAKPNPCVIATLRPDGRPVTVATWYVLDGDRILVNMDAGRKTRRAPAPGPTRLTDRAGHRQLVPARQHHRSSRRDGRRLRPVRIDRLSTHYLGNPYGQRDRPRVNAWIEIERWHTWEGGRPMHVESTSG